MIQARWDIVVRFPEGPLSMRGDITCKGPHVPMGGNPGPGGLSLEGYRGLDNIHATITVYDGIEVTITPVGTNQVRMAPHANVDWEQIQTLRGPAYLSPGAVVHLGAPNRGTTFVYVRCERFRWQEGDMISEANQANADPDYPRPTDIKDIDLNKGVPPWFVPAVVALFMTTAASLVAIVGVALQKPLLRPEMDPDSKELEHVVLTEEVLAELKIDYSTIEGFSQGFDDFVMKPNALAAEDESLREERQWDKKLLRYTQGSFVYLVRNKPFWKDLDRVRKDYHFVVQKLREAGMPEVFAAIPYQESKYRDTVQSYACAKGYWQFMPETARRVGLTVRDCKFHGSSELWSPTKNDVGRYSSNIYFNNNSGSCRIDRCAVDERTSLEASTEGAIALLREAWDHPRARSSGAVVQMAILAHNAGFNDAVHRGNKGPSNLLLSYETHLKTVKKDRDPSFYGANITCTDGTSDPHKPGTDTARCGGNIPNQTQHYGYNIIAQHLAAVCYYASNYPNEFEEWTPYTTADGYCRTALEVPRKEALGKGSKDEE